MNTNSYLESILQQRTAREKRLLANPCNWFSLIGLYLLAEGENVLGGKQESSINIPGLPEGFSAILRLNHGEVSLDECASALLVNGKSPELRALGSDRDEIPGICKPPLPGVFPGSIIFRLIQPGGSLPNTQLSRNL